MKRRISAELSNFYFMYSPKMQMSDINSRLTYSRRLRVWYRGITDNRITFPEGMAGRAFMLPENVSTNDTCPLVTWSLIDQPSMLRFRGDKQQRCDETRLRPTSRNDHLEYWAAWIFIIRISADRRSSIKPTASRGGINNRDETWPAVRNSLRSISACSTQCVQHNND